MTEELVLYETEANIATITMNRPQYGDAERMIGEIRGAAILGPVRGRPAYDTASLAKCLYALSDLIAGAEAPIAEIDLNPIKVLPIGQGCIIVDALIVPTSEEENGT